MAIKLGLRYDKLGSNDKKRIFAISLSWRFSGRTDRVRQLHHQNKTQSAIEQS